MPTGRSTPSPVAIEHIYPGYPMDIVVGSNVLFALAPGRHARWTPTAPARTSGDFTDLGSYYAAGATIARPGRRRQGDHGPDLGRQAACTSSTSPADVKPGLAGRHWPTTCGLRRRSGTWTATGRRRSCSARTASSSSPALDGTELMDGDANPGDLRRVQDGRRHLQLRARPRSPPLAERRHESTSSTAPPTAISTPGARTASNLPGFPVTVRRRLRGSPAVGSLDGCRPAEHRGRSRRADSLYVLNADGARRAGFPVYCRTQAHEQEPVAGAGRHGRRRLLDIVQASTVGGIYVWNGTASSGRTRPRAVDQRPLQHAHLGVGRVPARSWRTSTATASPTSSSATRTGS